MNQKSSYRYCLANEGFAHGVTPIMQYDYRTLQPNHSHSGKVIEPDTPLSPDNSIKHIYRSERTERQAFIQHPSQRNR
jgi:hypothetical protein